MAQPRCTSSTLLIALLLLTACGQSSKAPNVEGQPNSAKAAAQGRSGGAVASRDGQESARLKARRQNSWLQALYWKVRGQWQIPADSNRHYCVISIHLNQQGDLEKLMVVRSSGNEIYDESVKAAVRAAAPFPQPHDSEQISFLQMEFRPQ